MSAASIHAIKSEKLPQLSAEDPSINYADRASIEKTFPPYIQEQILGQRAKALSKAVHIEEFDLKAPMYQTYILKDTELKIEPNKKYALVGDAEMCSELIRAIAGGPETIKGFPKTLHVHHCKEIDKHDKAKTVLATVVESHEFRNALLAAHAQLKKHIEAKVLPADKLKDNMDYIEFNLRKINADTAEQRAQQMLRVLGFTDEKQSHSTNTLSGGLRMRVALCMAFFIEADILLLDEPTNHLDFPSVLWLENRLRAYRQTFLLVCHDRELLNNTCTSVMSLGEQKITYWQGIYNEYEKNKHKADKKRAEETDKFIKMHRNVDFSSPIAKELKAKKDWVEAFYRREVMMQGLFTFPPNVPLTEDHTGQKVGPEHDQNSISLIEVKQVRFTYDINNKNLAYIFDTPLDLSVTAGSRISIMGPNGAGKSTLLQLLTKRLIPNDGQIIHHPSAKVAYFAQHSAAELDMEKTAAEWMGLQFPDKKSGILRAHLAKVGISGGKEEVRMKQLSPGQRSCVLFAKITFTPPHLLIMDEPTNFLDIESVDSLINATNKYPGALLLVSHNRNFLLKCAKSFLSIVPGKVQSFNDLKSCERATYSFIEELEQGIKVSAGKSHIGRAGGDIVKEEKKKTDEDGAFTISSTPKPAAAKPAAAAAAAPAAAAKPAAAGAPKAEKKWAAGENCSALWTDGKYYPAKIDKVMPDGNYVVIYTEYGNKANLSGKKIQEVGFGVAKAAAAAPAKAAAGGKKK